MLILPLEPSLEYFDEFLTCINLNPAILITNNNKSLRWVSIRNSRTLREVLQAAKTILETERISLPIPIDQTGFPSLQSLLADIKALKGYKVKDRGELRKTLDLVQNLDEADEKILALYQCVAPLEYWQGILRQEKGWLITTEDRVTTKTLNENDEMVFRKNEHYRMYSKYFPSSQALIEMLYNVGEEQFEGWQMRMAKLPQDQKQILVSTFSLDNIDSLFDLLKSCDSSEMAFQQITEVVQLKKNKREIQQFLEEEGARKLDVSGLNSLIRRIKSNSEEFVGGVKKFLQERTE